MTTTCGRWGIASLCKAPRSSATALTPWCTWRAAGRKLTRRDQQMGDIIWLYYGAKWPMVRVGKHYGISEGKARELARAGAAWVHCAIDDRRQAA